MKKIFFLLICFVIFSCNVNDDSLINYQELLPIENVILPEEFILNETYEINIYYLRPTSCHTFNSVYSQNNNNEKTVAILSTVFQSNENCEDVNTELQATFNFKPIALNSYIFKFWQGKNDNGEDVYLTREVPVTEY